VKDVDGVASADRAPGQLPRGWPPDLSADDIARLATPQVTSYIVNICVCVCIYMYMCVCIYIYMTCI